MKEMLYYPYFEVRDENWLKFALLYFDRLRPVIPDSVIDAPGYLSDRFKQITYSTNFLKPYSPRHYEGERASIHACEEIVKYLSRPEIYGLYFNSPNSGNYIEKWKSKENQNTKLFAEKYSDTFLSFCAKENLATPCDEGIWISQDLAFVYMSLLADQISKEQNMEMITDEQKFSEYLISKDIAAFKENRQLIDVVSKELELTLPSTLNDIPIEKIIELRSRSDFDEARKEYVKVIDKIIAESKNGINITSEELLSCENEYKNFFKTIVTDIASGACGIARLIAKIYINIKTGAALDISITDTLQLMSVAGMAKGVSNMANQVGSVESKKLARKYVAKIKEL